MLGAMFSQNMPSQVDNDGCYFIDRDGIVFRNILQFLRSGEFIPPDNLNELKLLKCEAEFFQIIPLLECLRNHEKNMVEEKQIKTICISDISYKGYDRNLFRTFTFQSFNNNAFQIIHRRDITKESKGIGADIESKDFIKSIIDDAWILYEERDVTSYDELLSFLILNCFSYSAIDDLEQILKQIFPINKKNRRLVIFCYVKPYDNTLVL